MPNLRTFAIEFHYLLLNQLLIMYSVMHTGWQLADRHFVLRNLSCNLLLRQDSAEEKYCSNEQIE